MAEDAGTKTGEGIITLLGAAAGMPPQATQAFLEQLRLKREGRDAKEKKSISNLSGVSLQPQALSLGEVPPAPNKPYPAQVDYGSLLQSLGSIQPPKPQLGGPAPARAPLSLIDRSGEDELIQGLEPQESDYTSSGSRFGDALAGAAAGAARGETTGEILALAGAGALAGGNAYDERIRAQGLEYSAAKAEYQQLLLAQETAENDAKQRLAISNNEIEHQNALANYEATLRNRADLNAYGEALFASQVNLFNTATQFAQLDAAQRQGISDTEYEAQMQEYERRMPKILSVGQDEAVTQVVGEDGQLRINRIALNEEAQMRQTANALAAIGVEPGEAEAYAKYGSGRSKEIIKRQLIMDVLKLGLEEEVFNPDGFFNNPLDKIGKNIAKQSKSFRGMSDDEMQMKALALMAYQLEPFLDEEALKRLSKIKDPTLQYGLSAYTAQE